VKLSYLPALNASLNAICSALLIYGRVLVKRGDTVKHRRVMITALLTSALFLISYIVYHYSVGSVPYSKHDWTRDLYFAILIPHTILAAVMVPLVLTGLRFALKEKFDKHRRVVRWAWPIWMFVSVTGVVIYLMLYQL